MSNKEDLDTYCIYFISAENHHTKASISLSSNCLSIFSKSNYSNYFAIKKWLTIGIAVDCLMQAFTLFLEALILRKAAQASRLTENHSEFLHCRERGGAPGWICFYFKSNAILVYMELNGKKVAIQILGKIYCLL